jgi:predicted Zn-dependent protease
VKTGQIIAILGTLVLTVVIYLAVRTPKESIEESTPEKTEAPVSASAELDAKVDEAVKIIQSGSGAPMQAVALLREVISADSNHISANYWLGEFSMLSGQYDKAIIRFNKLCKLQPDNAEYCIKLAQAYKSVGQPQEGVAVLNQFLSTHADDNMKVQLNAALNEMSVEL